MRSLSQQPCKSRPTCLTVASWEAEWPAGQGHPPPMSACPLAPPHTAALGQPRVHDRGQAVRAGRRPGPGLQRGTAHLAVRRGMHLCRASLLPLARRGHNQAHEPLRPRGAPCNWLHGCSCPKLSPRSLMGHGNGTGCILGLHARPLSGLVNPATHPRPMEGLPHHPAACAARPRAPADCSAAVWC